MGSFVRYYSDSEAAKVLEVDGSASPQMSRGRRTGGTEVSATFTVTDAQKGRGSAVFKSETYPRDPEEKAIHFFLSWKLPSGEWVEVDKGTYDTLKATCLAAYKALSK